MKPIGTALFLLAMAAGAAAPVAAETPTHDRLTGLARDFIQASAEYDPLRATDLGLPGYDGRLEIADEASRSARIERLKAWKRQLAGITEDAGAGIGLVDKDDALLLGAQIASELNELEVRQPDRKDYARAGLRLTDALFTQFLNLPIPGTNGATQSDLDRAWDDIIARLSRGPAYIEAGQRLTLQPGQLFGTVGSKRLAGVADFLGGALTDAAKTQLAQRPASLQRFVEGRDAVLATLERSRAYIEAHVASWPQNYAIGRAAYDAMLRDEQLLPYDDQDLERMARDELAHGWAEEAWLTALSAQTGVPFGALSGGGMAPAGPSLVDYYRARIGELLKFVVDRGIVTIPPWLGSMEVVETPAFLRPVSPGAAMQSPRLFSPSTTGFYFITPPRSLEDAARRLDMNEDFDRDRIWSTAAHEAIPGHFFQLSIARRHPDYVRKIQFSGVFAEGWAFYGEEMFVRLGLYGSDLDARLYTARWERVRGARAVIDPKLATGEWTVAQAIEFFEAQSGFTHDDSEAAVHGIALNPGYVIAYTAGRLQLETLLGEYVRRKGAAGSLHDFHDRLLSYGTVPFSVVGPELLADLAKPAADVRAAANY
jgi:hypothetical protein